MATYNWGYWNRLHLLKVLANGAILEECLFGVGLGRLSIVSIYSFLCTCIVSRLYLFTKTWRLFFYSGLRPPNNPLYKPLLTPTVIFFMDPPLYSLLFSFLIDCLSHRMDSTTSSGHSVVGVPLRTLVLFIWFVVGLHSESVAREYLHSRKESEREKDDEEKNKHHEISDRHIMFLWWWWRWRSEAHSFLLNTNTKTFENST